MPRSIHRCPNCREPVTPFAAGCAICGADLEAARADLAARKERTRSRLPTSRLPSGALPSTGARIDWAHVAIAYILALSLSPIALILSAYWANQRRNSGDTAMMWLMVGALALSIAALVAPVWFWSHIY